MFVGNVGIPQVEYETTTCKIVEPCTTEWSIPLGHCSTPLVLSFDGAPVASPIATTPSI
jgi:hypothetical protein